MSGANSGCCSNAEKAQGQDKAKQSVVLKTWAVLGEVSQRLHYHASSPIHLKQAPFEPFLLCKKSPYLEIPNEEHQPFAIAPHCSQNVVQGPVAINLEPECRISGPTPHLWNPMLQLNKIPGKLYTHWRARGAGLINLPPSVPQDLRRQTQRLFCWSHVSTLSLSGVSILVLSWFPDEESGKRAPRGFPRLPRKWAPLLGPEPLLLEWFICWWVIQSDHNRLKTTKMYISPGKKTKLNKERN